MSDQDKRIKASSVAAFLFMPQLRLSFQHFSFVMPVFIRTVAGMFVQAGLLPQGHPAMRYGVEGIKKYKFSDLLGEAFHTLRTTRANPYQWSLFAAVIMMVACTILSFFIVLFHLSGMLIGSAGAQIFDHPLGDTGISTVSGPSGGGMFDNSVPASGTAHGDYGIMILDKMLRQGAEHKGGPLQNALGSLMQIYNTGVLMIAGIMIFWLIIFVVTDTAKTGQIGGQRHNMVWAPIRIVFALGLLIPLGSSGFSSGQFAVMKLAEWGSNFGTRGWVTYVDAVASGSKLVAKLDNANASGLVNQYTKMWICRVAYNGAGADAVFTPSAAQIVKHKNTLMESPLGQRKFSFTNSTNGNLCGTVTYATQNDPMLVRARDGDDPTAAAAATYKLAINKAYADLFITADPGTTEETPDNGLLSSKAKEFACGFTAQHIFAAGAGTSPLQTECGSDGGNLCGAGAAGSGQYPPTAQCHKDMVDLFKSTVDGASNSAHTTLSNFTTKPEFINDVRDRGWAGMGMWYHKISQMNAAVASMTKPPVSIADGILADVDAGIGNSIRNALNGQSGKTQEVIKKYNDWWEKVPAATATAAAPVDGAEPTGLVSSSGGKDKDVLSAIKSGKPTELVGSVVSAVAGEESSPFWFIVAPSPENTDLYPMAILSAIGQKIIFYGFLISAGISLMSLGAAIPFLGNIINAFMVSPMAGFFGTVSGLLIASGVTLFFYLPIIPFIRVANSVLTWMIAVFEAVMMVPIAALAHLNTEGEGLAGGAKSAWIVWLNMLMRPILTVIGYIGAILIFNTFVTFFNSAFAKTVTAGLSQGGILSFLSGVFYTVIYVVVIYTAANSVFKLLDLIPNAMMKYMGGSPDSSFDNDAAAGAAGQMGQAAAKAQFGSPLDKNGNIINRPSPSPSPSPPGASKGP